MQVLFKYLIFMSLVSKSCALIQLLHDLMEVGIELILNLIILSYIMLYTYRFF